MSIRVNSASHWEQRREYLHTKYTRPSISSISESEIGILSKKGRRRRRKCIQSERYSRTTSLSPNGLFLLLLCIALMLLLDATDTIIPAMLQADAFVTTISIKTCKAFQSKASLVSLSFSKHHALLLENQHSSGGRMKDITNLNQYHRHRKLNPIITTITSLNPRISTSSASSSTQLSVLVDSASQIVASTASVADYAPAATSLFNNMKLPAAVVTAGMISLGFATSFPELPRETTTATNNQPPKFPPQLRARCEALKRLHIVVALIAVTSELITVLWSAVEVNQLTEKQYDLAYSVWDLIQRDAGADLAWSAVNSHFALGIIGFVAMLALRAYVMLIAAEASSALMIGAGSGTGAALCIMISIVNRGVESGGGGGDRYGATMLDLFGHYAVLLSRNALDMDSPGPLQLAAIVLELTSAVFMLNVLLFDNGKRKEYVDDNTNVDGISRGGDIVNDATEMKEEEGTVDILAADSHINGERSKIVMVDIANGDQITRMATTEECKKIPYFMSAEEENEQREEQDEEEERRRDSDNSSVSII